MPDNNRTQAVLPVAVACMHLVVGRAILDFPTSTQARASRFVTIHTDVRGPLADHFRQWFPMQVDGQVWQNAVVPILEDPMYRVSTAKLVPVVAGAPTTKVEIIENRVLQSLYADRDWKSLLDFFVGALRQSYQTAGYFPAGSGQKEEVVEPKPLAPGEPLNRPDGSGRLVYEQFDC